MWVVEKFVALGFFLSLGGWVFVQREMEREKERTIHTLREEEGQIVSRTLMMGKIVCRP